MMKTLRVLAIVLGLSLIIGELWRSWGAERPFVFVIDDVIIGGFLIIGAVRFSKDTIKRRALLATGWGMNFGMLYISFFMKLIAPETTNTGNWNMGILTTLLGIAFATSIFGGIATLLLPTQQTEVS